MHAACVFFFCPMLVYFLRMTLSSLLPFVTHIRDHMARTPLPSPLPCLPSFQSRKKKGLEIGFLPWRPLASNWFAFMQPTSITRSTQAARRFLRSVRILMMLFQAYTLVIRFDNLLVVYVYMSEVALYRYHLIYHMILVSRYPENIIDVDISRKYRMIYR